MALMIPPKDLALKRNFLLNMQIATQYIANKDGVHGFYKGVVAGACKAAIGCYTYFAILRKLEQPDQSPLQNFVFSSIARIISTIVTNPLNIIETRFELADFNEYKNIRGAVRDIYRKEGPKGFLSGGLASCLKEGSFAGFYYMAYEELKDFGMNKMSAGMLAGMFGTAVTHPFELIRARLQIAGLHERVIDKHLIFKEIKILHQNKEWFKGVTPRLFKKPLANTITFLLFEMLEERQENGKA